jgi:hypothetical protein
VSEHTEQIASDFHDAWAGTLDDDRLMEAVSAITNEAVTAYPAHGEVVSLIFYLKFRVNVDNGKEFDGNAGGASSPGGGALIGAVYTDDIDGLYADTVSFEFQATPVYLSIVFFDEDSHALGTFQCGAISTVAGVGGGSGSWS